MSIPPPELLRLDRDLKLWHIPKAVIHDLRFQALCRARKQLILLTPIAAFSSLVAISFVGVAFDWFHTLVFVVGYVGGILLGDIFLWKWLPKSGDWNWRYNLALFIILTLLLYLIPSNISAPYTLIRYTIIGAFVGMFGIGIFDTLFSIFLSLVVVLSLGLNPMPIDTSHKLLIICIIITMMTGLLSSINIKSISRGLIPGIILAAIFGLVTTIVINLLSGTLIGVTSFATYTLAFLRLPFYLLWELPRSYWLSRQAQYSSIDAVRLWHKHPVHSDELIFFRYWACLSI